MVGEVRCKTRERQAKCPRETGWDSAVKSYAGYVLARSRKQTGGKKNGIERRPDKETKEKRAAIEWRGQKDQEKQKVTVAAGVSRINTENEMAKENRARPVKSHQKRSQDTGLGESVRAVC